jgi:hypothetical protein
VISQAAIIVSTMLAAPYKLLKERLLTNLISSSFVQFNRLLVLPSSTGLSSSTSSSTLTVSLSCALLSPGGVPLKLGVVGEILVVLVVLPTKWKFSGLLFDYRKLVNPSSGYILKK